MNDISAEIRDILVFHLGAEEAALGDNVRLAEDLGADSLDIIEIGMSCEEKFGIRIPTRTAKRLATVGDVIGLVEARLAVSVEPEPAPKPSRLRLALPG